MCPSQLSARNGGVAHTATAKHGNGVAPADTACIHRRPQSGHNATSHQASSLSPRRRVNLDGLPGLHQGQLGKCANPQSRRQRRTVM